jgi:hypothetical protein
MLFAIALLAISVAVMLSPSGLSAWASYQSPVSPVSPVSPALTPPAQRAEPSPTVPAVTSSPTLEAQQTQDSGPRTAILVAGGIVLIGLIAGATVLLMRGQSQEESES